MQERGGAGSRSHEQPRRLRAEVRAGTRSAWPGPDRGARRPGGTAGTVVTAAQDPARSTQARGGRRHAERPSGEGAAPWCDGGPPWPQLRPRRPAPGRTTSGRRPQELSPPAATTTRRRGCRRRPVRPPGHERKGGRDGGRVAVSGGRRAAGGRGVTGRIKGLLRPTATPSASDAVPVAAGNPPALTPASRVVPRAGDEDVLGHDRCRPHDYRRRRTRPVGRRRACRRSR